MKQFQLKLIFPAFFVGLIILLSSSLYAEEPQKKGPPKRLTPVVTATVSEQMLAPTIKVPGTIVSRQQAQLPAEVDGRLIWVAEVGTSIQWGEPVARLDDTLYRLQASENRATVQQKKTQLTYLEKELARLEELANSDFSSKTELDKFKLDRDLARSELVVAKAKVKVDEETLARYLVRAPFDGVVTERVKREGEWINGGETALTLSNPKRLEIEASVNENSIRYLKPGDEVKLINGEQKSVGTIRAIVGVGDATSHLFDIRIDPQDTQWLAGQTVKVEVPTGEAKKVVAVPRDALVLRRSSISIFKVNAENKAEKVNVSTGIASQEFIEVQGDVAPGDIIVTRGSERLRPGQEVQIIPGNS